MFCKLEIVMEFACALFENVVAAARDFRTDAVARQQDDGLFHDFPDAIIQSLFGALAQIPDPYAADEASAATAEAPRRITSCAMPRMSRGRTGFLLVGKRRDAAIDFCKFRVRGFKTEIAQAGTQRVSARVLSHDQRTSRNADGFRRNDFVGQRILDDAVLVNSRFVRECVGADDGFVGSNDARQ